MVRSIWMILLLLVSFQCFAEDSKSGQLVEALPWSKSSGELHAVMHLTKDVKAAYDAWSETPRVGYEPKIRATNTAKKGDLVSAIILISGYKIGNTPECDVIADYEVVNPDGTTYGRVPGMSICTKSTQEPGFRISESSLDFRIELSDQIGEYRINALVKDQLGDSRITLQQILSVSDR